MNIDSTEIIASDGVKYKYGVSESGCGRACGLWTIAEDSGLVIDALDGAPGGSRIQNYTWYAHRPAQK